MTVHTKVSANRSDKSYREEVEAAFRTIISWSGDDLDHCEYHIAPIIGQAWVAYVPKGRVVGISKLARVVEAHAKRFQTQERLTSEVASAVQATQRPEGVGVILKATHHCMSSRGIHKAGSDLVTSCMLGCLRENAITVQEF